LLIVRTDDFIPIRFAGARGERPLLLIHGRSDPLAPVSQARDLADAAGGSCRTRLVPGVVHVQAYQSDPESDVRLVGAFCEDHLSP
jgi:fermentation-respiration switch protein FrsA (DUF1100 family)